MENNKPKFKIGDRVRVKSLEEIQRNWCLPVIIRKPLKRFLGKTYNVTGLRKINGRFYYFLDEKTRFFIDEYLIESVQELRETGN